MQDMHTATQPNLKLIIRPKLLLGSLLVRYSAPGLETRPRSAKVCPWISVWPIEKGTNVSEHAFPLLIVSTSTNSLWDWEFTCELVKWRRVRYKKVQASFKAQSPAHTPIGLQHVVDLLFLNVVHSLKFWKKVTKTPMNHKYYQWKFLTQPNKR